MRPFATEEPSILNMQVPWDDQQEEKEHESGAKQILEWYRGQSWRSDPVCRGRVIMCGSWGLKQEAVILKFPWRHQDFEMLDLCDTCSGKLFKGRKPLKEKEW